VSYDRLLAEHEPPGEVPVGRAAREQAPNLDLASSKNIAMPGTGRGAMNSAS
jgi:hypothetical protein